MDEGSRGEGSRGIVRDGAFMTIDDIIENFSFLDDWDDRYRYVIELGRELEPLPDAERVDANQVQGCASQVWLGTEIKADGARGPVLDFVGDSDAHIVRGLIAILFAIYSGKPAREILSPSDAVAIFEPPGLARASHPGQRSNGFRSMVNRIQADAQAALAEAARRPVARGYLPRRRRCWPSPICLASCERAAA